MTYITAPAVACPKNRAMRLPRHKVIRIHCESMGTSDVAPACEHIQVVVVLEDPAGKTVERTGAFLAYTGIMHDPEQFPFQVAQWVREIMLQP